MANKQITNFPEIATSIPGDILHIARGGTDRKILVENLIPALGGFGTVIIDEFNESVDFTAGVSNTISLSQLPTSKNNTQILFDGIYQNKITYSLAGNLITFDEIIPEGVMIIEVIMPLILPLGVTTSADQVQMTSGTTVEDFLSGVFVFTSGNATPSVAPGSCFVTAGSTTITNFSNGFIGQKIFIRASGNITIQNNANILLSGAIDFNMTPNDTLSLIKFDGSSWYEISRSIN